MELELERTFLLKEMPKDLKNCKSVEVLDIYIPQSAVHPTLRIRRQGDNYEITKKFPIAANDASEHHEYNIPISEKEFEGLSKLKGKRVRKIRYFYPVNNTMAEIDVFLDDLAGLALADFEFNSAEEKANFKMPDFCLADVTQEEFMAGGFLSGKKYSDIKSFLEKYNYSKVKP